MPSHEYHCKESIRLFGDPYAQVNHWLDALAGMPMTSGIWHRRERHHEEGLNKVRKIFGEDAVKSAREHIISDLKMIGWTETDPFSKKRDDYNEDGFTVKGQKMKKEKEVVLFWE